MSKVVLGQQFGRWTVVDRAPPQQYGKIVRTAWKCLCACGAQRNVLSNSLLRGVSVSCGCLRREINSKVQFKHGASKTKLYRRWKTMRARCENPNDAWYEYYGARGIKVCDRWQDYRNFYDDMGEPPFDGATIERDDNDADYSPSNCRWATRKEQIKNRRLPLRSSKR